jgi:hypothetical protein
MFAPAVGISLQVARMTAILAILTEQTVLYRDRYVLVDRAGVCLFLAHPKFGEKVENDTGLHFQFPRQLVYPDFLHRGDC